MNSSTGPFVAVIYHIHHIKRQLLRNYYIDQLWLPSAWPIRGENPDLDTLHVLSVWTLRLS